ncbi:hypothetical protein AB0F15_23415 [Amycolatopsis sp. NPDC026612]|uniref:hypothetical protein n=1 Tax=Amycolatopsis sp. NPDC026612 TaxID=3155466 RepID=UPI0034004916
MPAEQPILPGDLVFFGSGPRAMTHVGIAVSAEEMVDAPDRGLVVRVERIWRSNFVGASPRGKKTMPRGISRVGTGSPTGSRSPEGRIVNTEMLSVPPFVTYKVGAADALADAVGATIASATRIRQRRLPLWSARTGSLRCAFARSAGRSPGVKGPLPC